MGWQSQRKRWLAITLLSGYVAAVGSSFHETQTMKHSRGTSSSRHNPKLLIVELGQEWRVVFFLYLLEDVCWETSRCPQVQDRFKALCSFPVKHSLPVFTLPPCARRKRQRDRLDKCDWSLTICLHTLHGTRGYRVIPEVAAYTQSR